MDQISQTLINSPNVASTLRIKYCRTAKELQTLISPLVPSSKKPGKLLYLGISILLSPTTGLLDAFAFATPSDEIIVLAATEPQTGDVIDFTTPDMSAFADILLGKDEKVLITGLNMSRIAMHVRHNLKLHTRGVELSELASDSNRVLSAGTLTKLWLDPEVDTFAVDTLWDGPPTDVINRIEKLCLRAWITTRIASQATGMKSHASKKITCLDTRALTNEYFEMFQRFLIEVELLELAEPREVEGEFYDQNIIKDGNAGVTIIIDNQRYKTHLRRDGRTEVHLVDLLGKTHRGRVTKVVGRRTHVALLHPESFNGASFHSISVVGKKELTYDEEARERFLMHLLQQKLKMDDPNMGMLRAFYFGELNGQDNDSLSDREDYRRLEDYLLRRLNYSQACVVDAMINSPDPFVVIQGPPGTGKTYTISAAVQSWASLGQSSWVIAQSNVGVKNVAERLSKDKIPYIILVSMEFYHEWNESIYPEEVKNRIIFTNTLKKQRSSFMGIKVILSTKCTIFNPMLEGLGIFKNAPVNNIVVDEASQISILSYIPLLYKFGKLSKLCFFGDPMQLPPHGKESASTLQSVFDIPHFEDRIHLLDIQYRLPVPLGDFISTEVYRDLLSSEHKIKNPSCVAFVDVSRGQERPVNTSFQNVEEVQTVIYTIKNYYRYKDVCVITPYDAQRFMIQEALKKNSLSYVNVYTVDSYQGNEADYIIISIVRTISPGFLESINRSNVMLTRCKKGMIIITNEVFIRSASVQRTLLGKLCAHWEREYGSGLTWKRFKEIENKSAKLPGSIGEGYDDDNGYTYDDEGCGNNGLANDKYGYNYHGSRGSENISMQSFSVKQRVQRLPRKSDVGVGTMIRGNKPKEGSTHWKTVMTPISTPSPVSGTINNFTQLPLSSNFTSFSGGTKCMPRFGGTGIMGAKAGNGSGFMISKHGVLQVKPNSKMKLKHIRELSPTVVALKKMEQKGERTFFRC